MKRWFSTYAAVLALTLAGVFLFGCATTPKIDWNSRVGHFIYDQAVLEMGPPDKSAKLQDGTLVAEWHSGRTPSTVVGFGVGGGYYWGGGADYHIMPGYDHFLRLTFGPSGQLTEWKKFSR